MLKNLSRARVIGAWFGAVAVLIASCIVLGAPITVNAFELWLVASLVPPAVMLMVWRGAPPATVAELLCAVNRRQQP